jgi:predicted DNA binding CopG/RHH family protein
MGFLSELGQFAGGVSKGISQEAVDRARREQAKAAKQEREEKERLASQDIEAAKATAIRRGTTYEPPVHEIRRPKSQA